MNWDWDKLQEKRQSQPGWKNIGGNGRKPREPKDPDEFRLDGEADERGRAARTHLGGGSGGGSGGDDRLRAFKGMKAPNAKWLILAAVGLWLLSGIYIVQPDESGVVLRFGRYTRTTGAGPHYHLPFPVEQVYKPKVSLVRQAEVGYRSQSSGGTFQQGKVLPVDEESSMLTGDENVVHVQFNIQYNVKSDGAVDYLFNVTQPDAVVNKAAEAAMREIIGKNTLDDALTERRSEIQEEVKALLQEVLDSYKVGIQVVSVYMQDVQPPYDVRDSFKDVASARENKEQLINQAEAYRRDILPKAQGRAAELVFIAEGEKQRRIQEAQGEALRYLSVLDEYLKAPDITRMRMRFETLENIMSRAGTHKMILPADIGDNVLPLLPLDNPGPAAYRPEAPNPFGLPAFVPPNSVSPPGSIGSAGAPQTQTAAPSRADSGQARR